MTKEEMKARMQEEARKLHADINAAAKAVCYYSGVKNKVDPYLREMICARLYSELDGRYGKYEGIKFSWEMAFEGKELLTSDEMDAVNEELYKELVDSVNTAFIE